MVIFTFFRGHGIDDGLDVAEALFIYFRILGQIREGPDFRQHAHNLLDRAHFFYLAQLIAEIFEGEIVLAELTFELPRLLQVYGFFDALEPFIPDRVVSRILGMGDVLGLIERAEKTIDLKQAKELERKLREDDFTLEDFRDQLRQIKKMGSIESLMGMLPKIGPFANLPKNPEIDEKRLTHVEAVINSMTSKERLNANLIDGKRRKRIAAGSGTSVQEVNQVLKQYADMKKMMKQYGALARTKMRGLGKFSGVKGSSN